MRRVTLIGAMLSITVLFLLLVWGPAWWFAVGVRLAAYSGATYALYLDTGHIFYGKISSVSGSTVVMRDVRSFQKFEVGGSTSNTLQAQKANALTKPENFLAINRERILFFEKVGTDAPILAQGVNTQ